MKQCPKCKKEIADEAVECEHCGIILAKYRPRTTVVPPTRTLQEPAADAQKIPKWLSYAWPTWWTCFVVVLLLIIFNQVILQHFPILGRGLFWTFGVISLLGIASFIGGVTGSWRRSRTRAAIFFLVAGLPQAGFIFLFVMGLFTPPMCGEQNINLGTPPKNSDELVTVARGLHDEFTGDSAQLCLAKSYIREALKLKSDNALAYVELAWIESKLGYINGDQYQPESLQLAQALINKALQINPQLFDAYIEGAYVYLRQGDFDGVQQMIAEAEKLKPKSSEANLVLAYVARRQGNMKEAEQRAKGSLHNAATKLQKISAYEILTSVYENLDDYDSADQAHQSILELDPHSAWGKMNYAAFLVNHGRDYDRAIEFGKAALKDMDFPAGHFTLSQALYGKATELFEEKQIEDATLLLNEAIRHYPGNDNAYYVLGLCYDYTGDTGKAIEAIETALKINPRNAGAMDAMNQIRAAR